MSLLNVLVMLTTKFFYTLTHLPWLSLNFFFYLLLPSLLIFACSPFNMCTRMLVIELFIHRKFYTFLFFLTKENGLSSYASSDSALDIFCGNTSFMMETELGATHQYPYNLCQIICHTELPGSPEWSPLFDWKQFEN